MRQSFFLHFTVAISLASLVFAPPKVLSAEVAPAPRSVYPRFDITYLPKVGDQGLIGFRPCEVARYGKGPELTFGTRMMFDFFFDHLVEGDLSAAELPPFADIEQCVFNFHACIRSEPGGKHGQAEMAAITPFVIKAVRPLDWNPLIRKWFPKGKLVRFYGKTYLSIPCTFIPEDAGSIVLYSPDDRTLVAAWESHLRDLIERLADGKPAPAPPPGWADVDREFAAIAFDNRNVPFLKGAPLSPTRPGVKEFKALIDAVETMSLSISVGDRSAIRMVVVARDKKRAKDVRTALRSLLKMTQDEDDDEEDEEPPGVVDQIVTEAIDNSVLDRNGRRVVWTTSVKRNLIHTILMLAHGSD